MIGAVALFALMDTALKLLSKHYPAMQVAALRGLSALPLVAAYVVWRGAGRKLMQVRWAMNFLRAALAILMLVMFTYALRNLPLTEAYTLFFISPLLITVLSVFFLKEKVTASRWVALAIGMAGVLVALRPTGAGFLSLGSLAVLGAAACYAGSAILVRVLGRTDSSEKMMFWMTVFLAAGASLLAAPEWAPVRAADWFLILGLAVTGFLGVLLLQEAFRHGDASAIAPFEYTALAWGVGLDWVLWRTLPDQFTLLGAAIIIGSGVYLIRRESVHCEAERP